MKISLLWLSDFVEFTENDPVKIAEAVTAHTAEVDEVEFQGELLDHCCVGKVLKIEKHPDADKLQLCEVLTDKGAKQIVCGGSNLRQGMRVAFAHVGARVKWHGEEMMTLEPVKIRGEKSEGMICTAEELDLENTFPESKDRVIIDMGDSDQDIGKPLRDVLGLDDVVLHIDNHAITHRADLFSHIGFARECVAIGIAKWKKLPEFKKPSFPKDAMPFAFRVTAKDAIPRYCSCLLEIDGLGQTPEFMVKRLSAVGIRSLSLPIDITNYVMLEMGLPMHSFDVDDIQGDIVARIVKEGEPLMTLDKKEWKLPEGALVFSDELGNFDLVGIMGGLRSSTKDTTRRIYLHGLSLDPVRIRHTIIATGHRTDAATIYEKGVPHITTELGFYRALELFLEHVPGAKIISAPETCGDNGSPKPVALSLEHTQSLLGVQVSEKEVKTILSNLDFTVEGSGEALMVTPPLHRLGDIEGEHDLIEEVGRMYGFNNIEITMPDASTVPPVRDQRVHIMRDGLKEQGYFELLPLSLVGPDLVRRCKIDPSTCTELENPIGKETSLMTPSTLPALLEHAEKNMLLVPDALRTFHISTVFADGKDDHLELGMLVAAKHKTDLKTDPFLLLKQELTEALFDAGYAVVIDVCKEVPAFASKGRCARVQVDGTDVGLIFEVDASVRSAFDLPARSAGVLLNLTVVLDHPAQKSIFQSLPSFPAVTYDTTVTMNHKQCVGDVLEKIRSSSDLLESAEIADLYGQSSGDYQLTLRCTYRAEDKTLTEEEAKKEFAKVEKLLS